MSENLKFRLRAAGIHLCGTVFVATLACALIFFVWFPGVLASELGGFRLFALLVGCDIILGPLLTFVVFNKKKKKKLLIFDLCIIVTLQLAALTYGLSVVANSRPVYVVFLKDRLEIITASELDDASYSDLTPETEKYARLPFYGYKYASIKIPEERAQRTAMMFESLATGKDYSLFLKFYQDYDLARDEIRAHTHDLLKIDTNKPGAHESLEKAIARSGLDRESMGWLLVKHKYGFITALINKNTGQLIEFLPFDPEPAPIIKQVDTDNQKTDLLSSV